MPIQLADLFIPLRLDSDPYDKAVDQAEAKTRGFGLNFSSILKGAALGATAALVAGVAAVGKAAFDVSSDTRAAALDMATSLGIPTEKAEEFAQVAKRVYGNNFAGSVGEAADAVKLLAQQIDGLGDDSTGLQKATERAFALRDTFDVDVAESVDAVNTLMSNFGISADEAFDLVTAGFQRGLNRSGDFLDTIGEYSTQFKEGGADASQFFGFLESGLQGGVLGTDKAADAFKEFRLRINDGSKATREAADALFGTADATDQFFAGLQSGSITGAQAFEAVIEKLQGFEHPARRMQLATALLGTQFEDLGDSAALGLSLADDSFANLEGTADSLNARYENLGDFFAGLWRRTVVAVTPLTDKLLELANDSMPAIEAAFTGFEGVLNSTVEAIGNVGAWIDRARALFSGFGESVGIDATGQMQYFKNWIDTNLPLIKELVGNVVANLTAFWQGHGDAITRIVTNVLQILYVIWDTQLKTILDLVQIALQLLTGDFSGAFETLKGIVTRAMQNIKSIFSLELDSLKTIAFDFDLSGAGGKIVQTLLNGMIPGMGNLTTWFAGKLGGLRDMLPFSEPKDPSSPLRNLGASGEALIGQIQKGINSASLSIQPLADAMQMSMTSGMQPAAAGAMMGSTGDTFNIVINAGPNTDTNAIRSAAQDGVMAAKRARGS